jgi:hypothetical protein
VSNCCGYVPCNGGCAGCEGEVIMESEVVEEAPAEEPAAAPAEDSSASLDRAPMVFRKVSFRR